MKDRISQNPGRVLITPEDGSSPFYATMTRADNPTQEGDPLNKNTLLKDATAALFGLGADAVPNDVFSLLKTLVTNAQSSADEKAKIETGYYTGTGVFGQSNPNVLNFDFPPTYVIIFDSVIRNGCIYMNELTTTYVGGQGPVGHASYSCDGKKSSDGKTIYWYSYNGTAKAQLNESNVKYYYMAIQ